MRAVRIFSYGLGEAAPSGLPAVGNEHASSLKWEAMKIGIEFWACVISADW